MNRERGRLVGREGEGEGEGGRGKRERKKENEEACERTRETER